MKIIKPFLPLIGILFISLFFVDCKSTKDSQKAHAAVENYDLDPALLWKIEGNGLAKVSYLFGTIHMIDADKFFWPPKTLAAFDESEQVAFEIDMNEMNDLGAQMGLMTKAFMKDGLTLKDLYSEEDYATVKNHLSEMGLPMFLMEKLKPMFLTVFASGDIDMSTGFGAGSSMKSYEMEFMSLAKDSEKAISGLETIEYQLSVFDSIPYTDQAQMLLESITSSDAGDDQFAEMMDMYLTQDISAMSSMMGEEEAGIGGYEDILLFTRNKNWIPIMSDKMKTASTFFAVGAGHLGGKDGVIDLLKKAGYKLTPVSQVSK